MPPRAVNAMALTNGPLDKAYSLSLLSEYTHTLDSLPLDLSRNFADLRELDAVLSSSMTAMTSKINSLTRMLEDAQRPGGTAVPKEERLWLLTEIAEEAARLKMGGEDKIRVAYQAADNLKSHTSHMRTLLSHIPPNEGESTSGFESAAIPLKTVYPHISSRSYMPAAPFDTRSRRRGGFSSLLVSSNPPDPSPAKRKRVARDDDDHLRSPRKERPTADPKSRNARAKKISDRGASPAESLLSVTSHVPARQANSSRANGTSSATSAAAKRARTTATTMDNHLNGARSNGNSQNGSSTKQLGLSVPSLGAPYSNTSQAKTDMGYMPMLLPGPGLPPLSDDTVMYDAHNGAGDSGGAEGDGDGDADGEDSKIYCFCDRVSFGEMIACDDNSCEREWFHLACIGLDIAPEGSWICETCRQKRNAKRAGRAGTKRKSGGRAGGR